MNLDLVVIGIVLSVLGGLGMLGQRAELARRRRILGTPIEKIARAKGGVVEVEGTLVAGENGTLVAPFSGRDAVYVRVWVQETRGAGKYRQTITLVDEGLAHPFYVDDGSGELARIEPNRVRYALDPTRVASSGTFHEPPLEAVRFLAERGITSTSMLGFNKALTFVEEVLCPGDPICALGPAEREPGPPGPDGYRSGATSVLVLRAKGMGDAELIVSNSSQVALARKLHRPFVGRCVITLIGLSMLLLGLHRP